jgi:hypothetical protein
MNEAFSEGAQAVGRREIPSFLRGKVVTKNKFFQKINA